MRDPDNIRQVEALGIDMMGFIFWPGSSRCVSAPPSYLPVACKRVGVFVDATVAEMARRVAGFCLDAIQLHGHEPPDTVRTLRSMFTLPPPQPSPIALIKAFNISAPADLDQTVAYEQLVDCFLFDTKGKAAGGSGRKFDWSILNAYHGPTPFLLSGGIGPGDAGLLESFHHPRCIGIDLNSRFELSPALKDVASLSRFLDELNTAKTSAIGY